MDILLCRLIKNETIVGYEKHEGGKIYHNEKLDDFIDWKSYHPYIKDIEHDSKELWTGEVDNEGNKIFENDKIMVADYEHAIIYHKGSFGIWKKERFEVLSELFHFYTKVIGRHKGPTNGKA